jgi:hypothetical protein
VSTNQPLSDPSALPVIETVLATVPPIAPTSSMRGAQHESVQWKSLEERIAAWAPANDEPDLRTDEDGYLLPSGKTVAVALQVAARLREAGVTIPLRLVQDAIGGIDFEWRSENRAETLTVNSRGQMELMTFEDSKLTCRKMISFASARR